MQPIDSPQNRFGIFSWTLFDFANTAFYVIILTIAYPLYFKEIVAQNRPDTDFLWGFTFSISMCVVALISPILGAASDEGVGKKKFLLLFTALCILSTSFLFFITENMIVAGMILLILANIGFEGGLVFYDSFLPELTSEKKLGRISGYGYAMGYVGSLATLIIVYPLLQAGFIPENLMNIRLSFLLAAGLFLVFATPLFIVVRDRQQRMPFRFNFIGPAVQRVTSTFRQIKNYRNIHRFLLSYFIYIDAVNTIIIFSSLYARETLQMSIDEIVVFFALVQTSAIVGSLFFGFLADRLGQKRTLSYSLFLWLLVIAIAYSIPNKPLFLFVGIIAGIAMGSSQSISRSLMTLITPPAKKTEFFGFYSFFGKASAILGPLIFGIISSNIDQRTAVLSIGFLILIGLALLHRVSDQKYSEPVSSYIS